MRLKILLLGFVGSLLSFVNYAGAQWTDGQNAAFVVGQPDFTTVNFAISQNGLGLCMGVAIDVPNGKLYVSDSFNHRVLRYAWPVTGNQPNAEVVFGQLDFVSGNANQGAANPGSGTLAAPSGLTVDSSGNLWVADGNNHRVVRYDAAHTVATNGVSADLVIGQTDFVSSSIGMTQSTLHTPSDVVIGPSGNLWVCDRINYRVLRFANAGSLTNGAAASGVLGQTDFTSSSSGLTASTFNLPTNLAMSGSSLYVSDYVNRRVLRFDNAATLADSDGANATGVLGQSDFVTDSSAVTQSGLTDPFGVAVDNDGGLYIGDSTNNRVLYHVNGAAKADGANADHVLGQSLFTTNGLATTQNGMHAPTGIAVDSVNDQIAVVEFENRRVLIFDASAQLPVDMSGFALE